MTGLHWAKEDEELLDKVRELQGSEKEWSTKHQVIIDLRARLLELQKSRCAYCQGPIESTANGFVELDHILPKKQNGKEPERIKSDDFENRLVTFGYAQFMYEPLNLVVTCRACNSSKNSFDPLRIRTNSINSYPDENDALSIIQWYHPHFHIYEKHIKRTRHWTFEKESEEGDYTIRACKLDIPEQLNKRFQARADASLTHSPTIRVAINALATSILQERYGLYQGIAALVERCKLTEPIAKNLIETWISHVKTGTPRSLSKANEALQMAAISWEGSESFDLSAEELSKISEEAEK